MDRKEREMGTCAAAYCKGKATGTIPYNCYKHGNEERPVCDRHSTFSSRLYATLLCPRLIPQTHS